METLKFKTSVQCSGCIAIITPYLDKIAGAGNWEVDTQDPGRILKVQSANPSAVDIIEALKNAGYKAELI